MSAEVDSGFVLAGRYRLDKLLGRGGMGEVWQGRDLRLGRAVAVKVMLQDADLNPTARTRFQQEAMIAAGLRHDGITTVYDAAEHTGRDRHAGRLFIVSELLDGQNLAEYLAARPGGLPVSQAIGFGIQLADALAFAHDRGIVHRDLKPPNIFVQDRGGLKVCDFGIAGQVNAGSRFTQAGLRLGTPAYMAPEQWEGKPAAPSMDLYALGCLLYLMATGTQPFDGRGGLDHVYMQQHFHEPPVPPLDRNPQVPAALNGLILALLAKAPEARPPDAHAVLRALTRLRDAPGGSRPVALTDPAPAAAPPQPATGSAPTAAMPPVPAGLPPGPVLRRAALIACASPDLDNFEVLAAGQSGRIQARQDTADGEALYGASGRWLPWFTASELPGPVTALAGSMSRPGGHWAVAAVADGVPYLKLGPQEARPLLDAGAASPVSLPVRDVAVSHAPEMPQVFALDRVGSIWRLSWPDVKWVLFSDSLGPASESAAAIAAACSSAGYQAVAAVAGTRLLVRSRAPYGDWTGWRAADFGRRLLGTACSVGERHCAVFTLDDSGAIWRSAFRLDQPAAPESTALAWDAVSPPPGGVTGIAATALEARGGAADGGALLVAVTADGAVHSARYELGYGFQPQWSGWRQMPTLD